LSDGRWVDEVIIGIAIMTRQANKANDLLIPSSFGGGRDAAASAICQIRNNAYQQVLYRALARTSYTREGLNVLGSHLISIIFRANAARQMDAVAQISELMLGLPIPEQMKALARYYQGVCLYLQREFDGAQQVFERTFDEVAPEYQGRALHHLGLIHHDRGEIDAAVPFFFEALKAAKGYDPLTEISTHWFLAIDRSIHGDHKRAVADLENLFPLVRAFAGCSGAFYDYLNSYAVELGEVGRLDEANAALNVALATPFASAYPNWTRTQAELAAKSRVASPSVVAISIPAGAPLLRERLIRRKPLRINILRLLLVLSTRTLARAALRTFLLKKTRLRFEPPSRIASELSQSCLAPRPPPPLILDQD